MKNYVVKYLMLITLSMWVYSTHASYAVDLTHDILEDYAEYYSAPRLKMLVGFTAVSGVSANTSIDSDIRRTWQERVHGKGTRPVSTVMNFIRKEGALFVPVYMGLSYMGRNTDSATTKIIGAWGDTALRAVAVATPEFFLFAKAMGPGRPEGNDSHWRPFKKHYGVSGHAFFGGIPFLSAAKITLNPRIKTAWYIASILPALARIDADKHYFSQVLMGWGLAYMGTHTAGESIYLEVDGNSTFIMGRILL